MASIESKQDLFKNGMKNLENNHIEQAISNFSKALTLDSNFADAYLFRGLAYDLIHRVGDSIPDCRKALELNPEISLTYPIERKELLDKIKCNQFSELIKFNDTIFSLNANQCHKLEEWYNSIFRVYEGVSGGALTFSFTPTSLGTITRVTYGRLPIFYKLGLQNESIDLTEYEDW